MEISGHLHAAIVLPPGKEHPLHTKQAAGRKAEPVGTRQYKVPALDGELNPNSTILLPVIYPPYN